jgi:hypothetical protein
MINAHAEKWFGRFWQAISERVAVSEIDALFKNISFVSFNYDRCLELFLEHAIVNYYGVEETKATELLQKLKIFHPYGTVGSLPWQQGNGDIVGFAADDRTDLWAAADRLKTFTERIEEGEELLTMRDAIASAECLVFLGFGFHEQNLSLLRRTSGLPATIYATTMGISKSDQAYLRAILERIFNGTTADRMRLLDGTCADLFEEYRLSLPFGQ